MSAPQPKARGDSVLKTLPKERQADIAEYANAHTLKETVAWLAADGLRTNKSSVSDWLSSWHWQAVYAEAETDAGNFMELVRTSMPDVDEAKVEQFGNAFFQMRAVKKSDDKMFLKFRTARNKSEMEKLKFAQKERELAQKDEQIRLEREKFERLVCEKILDTATRDKAAEIASQNISRAEQIAEMRQALFSDVDALQQAGSLKLPK
jgi:hypothetical protein